jgi:hypothetical protein
MGIVAVAEPQSLLLENVAGLDTLLVPSLYSDAFEVILGGTPASTLPKIAPILEGLGVLSPRWFLGICQPRRIMVASSPILFLWIRVSTSRVHMVDLFQAHVHG